MERDANVDKKKQMTLTFQMRRRSIFDVLSPSLKDLKTQDFFVNLYHSFVNEYYACKIHCPTFASLHWQIASSFLKKL